MTKMTRSLLLATSLVAAAGVGYAAAQTMSGAMTAADEFEWAAMAPDSPIMTVTLWGDPAEGPYGALLKLPAGLVVPVHAHTGDYDGINLAGTWRHSFEGGEERDLPAGSHVFQPGLGMHGDACLGPEDCIIFVRQDVARDFIPKEQ